MKGQLLFLGTGGSLGVPVVGCTCPICKSDNPRNKRLRTAAFLKVGGRHFFIDVGPDFRYQALRSHIDHVDGIIFTHSHYDHVGGFDDLRPFYYKKQQPLVALASKATAEDIKMRFDYIFKEGHPYEKFTPRLEFHYLPSALHGEINFLGVPFRYVTYEQGHTPVNGFCAGSIAYLTDIHEYDPSIFDHLKGIETLVLSALRFTPSPLHLSLDEAVEFSLKVGAKQVWFTHISHDVDHEKANAYLPSNIQLAYDGLEIDFG